MRFVHVGLLMAGALAGLSAWGQQASGGRPWGLAPAYLAQTQALEAVLLPAPDLKTALEEDARRPGFYRISVPIPTNLDFQNAGQWTELPNGDRFWTLKLHAPDAQGLAILYEDFYLPPGARLFMYAPDGQQVLGAYTHKHNTRTNRFLTGFVHGHTALVEYFEPASQRGQGTFRIFRADYAYKPPAEKSAQSVQNWGFGASWPCHVNAACPPGDTLGPQKRSVCHIRVVVQQGIGDFTGTLLNNTNKNAVPYVLTAYHAIDGYTPLWDLWRFDFLYQSPTCANPATEPPYLSLLGCDLKAGRRENDFLLVELFQQVPGNFQAYFAGWDRSTGVPARSTFIHHPRGDIKKISVDTLPAVIQNTPISWPQQNLVTPTQHHFRVRPKIGAFQEGSSGAALFNQHKLVVGNLHGGLLHCDTSIAYFARLALAWNGGGSQTNRLRDWLDPGNKDSITLSGMENPANALVAIAGIIRTEGGAPIPGVKVWITGNAGDTLVSDASGEFVFTGLLAGGTYELRFLKDNNHANGVSTQDVIRIQRQILSIEPLSSPYKQFAADVNGSKSVSTLDLVLIRRLILSIADRFPDVTSWQFLPANYPFDNPANPLSELTPNQIVVPNVNQNTTLQVVGVKSGDVNESANPAQ